MISIIIPTYNRDEVLNATLSSLISEVDGIDAEVIVVNDFPDRAPVVPGEIAKKVLLLNNPKRGVGAARNYGVKNSKGDYIIFLDDDFLVNNKSLLMLKELLDEHVDKVFNAAWEYPPDLVDKIKKQKFGRYLIWGGFTSLRERMKGDKWDYSNIFERSKGISSGILAITRQNFIKTGGYSEEMVFGNDLDFSLRIKSVGLKPYVAPTITAYHNEWDKVNLELWLTRRKYGISQLVKHKIVERVQYSRGKKRLLKILSRNKRALIKAGLFIPNLTFFDRAYRLVINALLATYLYEAYTEEQ